MAELLISCDDYIFLHKGKYYFKNQEWNRFYHRYLRVFEGLRIVNRVIPEETLKEGRVPVEDPRIEIYPVPVFHGPYEYVKKYFSVGRALRGAAKGCDAAVLRLPSTVAQRLAPEIMGKMPYACEVVFNAKDGYESASGMVEKLLWRVIDYRMRRICRSADGVSCVTRYQLQERYRSEKPGSFSSYYSSLELQKEFFGAPRPYPSAKPRLTIAHVSNQIRLNGRKGESVLIEALARLKERGVEVNLEFAGDDWDGSSRAIKDYASKLGVGGQVSCVGYLDRAALARFLDSADLFVLPTRAEGLPRVIIEAMAKGLPVITTPVSGNPELVPEPFLVEYSDVGKLAHTIGALVSDSGLYEKASSDNYSRSLEYEASVLEARRDEFYGKLHSII
ncbi:MAG: glycosyltransferase family 4 protein [Bacteroidales bacterium]|nr:glycosyltransferase family 4 protein [Bacteroidales bacterium]